MKVLKIAVLTLVTLGLLLSGALAVKHTPEERGKALFNDPKLGGGTAGKSCNNCHPDGKGIEKAAERKDLEKTINNCINASLKGKGIDPNSEQMKDLVAYVKSVKGNVPVADKPAEKPKKKKAIEGC